MPWHWMNPEHTSRLPWPLRLVVALVGLALVLVGIVLWILPVVAGWPLILMGLPLLFGVHPRGAALYHRLRLAIAARARRVWAVWRTRAK